MARVDVVIPLYNKEGVVGRAVRSVVGQTLTDWRLIVVDDGSTDNGAAVVERWSDERIELLRQDNAGPGAARNAGAARGASEFLAFLDADDEWYPWYLANAVAALERNEVQAVSSFFYEWPAQRDVTGRYALHGVAEGIYELTGEEEAPWVSTLWSVLKPWNTVLRRAAFGRWGGFYDVNRCLMGEDQAFFARVLANEPVAVIGPPAVRYHMEASALDRGETLGPAPAYLQAPEYVLEACPEAKKPLMRRVLAWRALAAARRAIRLGEPGRAEALLERFPEVGGFPDERRWCARALARGAAYGRWVNRKRRWEQGLHGAGRRWGIRLGLVKGAPRMDERQANES